MKKSKFSSRLRLLFSKPKAERRKMGISEAMFYRWKQLYGDAVQASRPIMRTWKASTPRCCGALCAIQRVTVKHLRRG
jgi:hypothetical protein